MCAIGFDPVLSRRAVYFRAISRSTGVQSTSCRICRPYRSLRLNDRGTMVQHPARATDLPLLSFALLWVKQSRRQADHSPSYSVEAKNEWSYLLQLPRLHHMTFNSKQSHLYLFARVRIPDFRFISLSLLRSTFLISHSFFTSLCHSLYLFLLLTLYLSLCIPLPNFVFPVALLCPFSLHYISSLLFLLPF